MRSLEQIAAEADLMQARAFAAQFTAQRRDLEQQLNRHTESLAAADQVGDSRGAAQARRSIRDVETDLRDIARMLETIEHRFPPEVSP